MPEYHVKPQTQETWTRGQIFRTAIIFAEIVVLLTVILLNSINGADAPAAAVAPLPEVVANLDTDRMPTTIYVTNGFRVFVMQNTVHQLVGRLADCSNRYLDSSFDGVLISDLFTSSRHDIIHMAAFLTDTYDVDSSDTEVTLILDDGRTYTVALHCNGQFGADTFGSAETHRSTSLEDLVSVAQRHNNYAYDYFDYSDLEPVQSVSEVRQHYDYGAGYGCRGDHR